MAVFEGVGVAIVTPMREDYSVNYEKLAELIEFHVENGTDSIIICGTTGEASTLSHEEHLECIRFTVEKVAGRLKVIAGTGSNCTETAVYLSTEAEKYGADALLVVAPYYNKATQNGLIAHFTTIAESVSIPVILYNVPSRTGSNILPDTVYKLVTSVKNIVGIKDATDNLLQTMKMVQLCGESLELYSGNDDQITPMMSLGAKGVISVLANFAPKQTRQIVTEFMNGNIKKSRELQMQYFPLIRALFSEVNPIPVKKAMNLLGFEVGPLRLPLTEMEEATTAALRQELVKTGFLN